MDPILKSSPHGEAKPVNLLGFCSISALDRPLAAAAELAAACGVDGLEVTAHPPHLNPDDGPAAAREIGNVVRQCGLEVIAYGSYLGRFGRTSAAHARQDAQIAAALQTPLMRVWAEPISSGAGDFDLNVALLQSACEATAADGITVVVERHLGSFADNAAQIARLLEAVGRPNIALNYQVLDFLPASEVDNQAADAAALIHCARYFHLKNYQLNPDPTSSLLPGGSLADGVLDYRAILAATLAAGYQGPLSIEFLAADERPVEAKLAADVAFIRALLAELRG